MSTLLRLENEVRLSGLGLGSVYETLVVDLGVRVVVSDLRLSNFEGHSMYSITTSKHLSLHILLVVEF